MTDTRFLPTFYLLGRLLQTLEQSDYEALGSGAGQGRILAAVVAEPGISPQTLVGRFGTTKSSVSQAAHRLEAMGYLAYERDPYDARRRRLVPTPLGRPLARLFAMHESNREKLTRRYLSDEEVAQLDRLLYRAAMAVGEVLRSRGVR